MKESTRRHRCLLQCGAVLVLLPGLGCGALSTSAAGPSPSGVGSARTGEGSPATTSFAPEDEPAAEASAPRAVAEPDGLSQVWSWEVPDGFSAGLPAGDDQNVAVVYGRRNLVLFDGLGEPQWEAHLPEMRDVAPLLAPGFVATPTESGIAVFDRDTGRLRWTADVGDRANTPAVSGTTLVTTTWEGSVVAFDGDGSQRWRQAMPGGVFGSPAAGPGGQGPVVVTWDTGRQAAVVALEVESGRELWSREMAPDGLSAPSVIDGRVVVVDGAGMARALDAAGGAQLWAVALEDGGSQEVAPVGGGDATVVVPHRLGGMARIELATGELLWEATSEGALLRGQPAGPGPGGSFAMGLVSGSLLLASGPGPAAVATSDSLVSGVARGPAGVLVITTAHGPVNEVVAVAGW